MSQYSKDIDWQEFKDPPKSARPMVRWWWPGLDVEEEELVREVQELDEAGFLGAEIQVFMIGSPWKLEKKDKIRAARCHRFMQPYYYEMVKAVLDEASKRNMIMDVTIGSAWPAGSTEVTKEDSLRVVLVGEKVIKGPKIYTGKLPKIKKPFIYKLLGLSKWLLGYNLAEYWKEDMKLMALIAAKPINRKAKVRYLRVKTRLVDEDTLIDLTDKINENGILEWDVPEGKWQIFAFFEGPSGVRPLLDCRSDPNKLALVLDHLSSEAINNHLDSHLGEGKKLWGEHFGETLRAFFTDSLELSSEWLWTKKLLETFKEKRGYDLKPYLPVCFVPNRDNKYAQALLNGEKPVIDLKDDIGEKIRYDYEKTISDLFSEEFAQTMMDWAEKNNLKSRIQGYGIRADTLKVFKYAHIPETEQLYAGGVIDFLKLAGSASILYERQIVTAESIVWNQRDYMTTPLKMKVAADRLFASGINQMIYHGFPYLNPLFPYPGFCGFSTPYLPKTICFSSNFSRVNPFWEFFPIINKYITRCQYLLQHGKTVCNIAIYYPLFNYADSVLKREELVGGYLNKNDGRMVKRQIEGYIKKKKKWNSEDIWTSKFHKLTDEIHSKGYLYSHINDENILKGSVKDEKLSLGHIDFDLLIFPDIDAISLDLAEKLEVLATSKVKIIFMDNIPFKQNGFLNYKENDIKIEDILLGIKKLPNIYFAQGEQDLSNYLMSGKSASINPDIAYEEPQPSIYFIHKKTINSENYFLRNSSNQPKNVVIRFLYAEKVPFILDPWTGDITQAISYQIENSYVKMDLYFEAYGSNIVMFKKDKEEPHLDVSRPRGKRTKNGDIISLEEHKSLKPFNLNNWKFKCELRDYRENFTLFELDMIELKDWREISGLKYCSAHGYYYSTIKIGKEYIQENLKLILTIQRVHDVAVVKVNDVETPPLLVYPYEVDITSLIKEGENAITIEVIPSLKNRLIGYGKKGGKNWKNHKKRKNFMPSGLIGPIRLVPYEVEKLN